ncbi:DUF3429 domain-containing protein [Granulosicoccus antarcticus]|uniref:DUF3429 domain-containing protein n=1 Tax=Granulosicoccus antarcticus IMCC3135 TaxID=1192854 RepID=A0A2Z2NHS7_9GAMM|nr:DUF3429 domain-containing protein [Granulosicoccus antarcticus]ASJ70699.1 hypothetical protein IMCC3135_02930 [Granulosicoccus antarcticus IMCC3135]
MNRHSATIPRPALILGLGGLLPFFTTALIVCLVQFTQLPAMFSSDFLVHALGAYGAVILSFLGGVRWGKLLDDEARLEQWAPLTLSILPSLIAWLALLLETRSTLLLLTAGFALQYAQDRAAARRHELPDWFARLRLMLTSGAMASLLVAFIVLISG